MESQVFKQYEICMNLVGSESWLSKEKMIAIIDMWNVEHSAYDWNDHIKQYSFYPMYYE